MEEFHFMTQNNYFLTNGSQEIKRRKNPVTIKAKTITTFNVKFKLKSEILQRFGITIMLLFLFEATFYTLRQLLYVNFLKQIFMAKPSSAASG